MFVQLAMRLIPRRAMRLHILLNSSRAGSALEAQDTMIMLFENFCKRRSTCNSPSMSEITVSIDAPDQCHRGVGEADRKIGGMCQFGRAIHEPHATETRQTTVFPPLP